MIRNNTISSNPTSNNPNYMVQPLMLPQHQQQQHQDPYAQMQNAYYVPYQQPHPILPPHVHQQPPSVMLQQYMVAPMLPMQHHMTPQLFSQQQQQHNGIKTPPNTYLPTQLPSIQKVFNSSVDSNQQLSILTPNSSTTASSSVSSPSIQPILLPPLGGYTTTNLPKKNYTIIPQPIDYHNRQQHSHQHIRQKSLRNNSTTTTTTDTPPRKRRRTTKEQRQILKEAFIKNKAPSKEERLILASQCNMNEKSIQVWFQNQRQYMRREQNLRALQKFQIIH
ncbi:hypothetical protein MOSE0_I01090 [Monosporozyma servazzii]